MDPSVELHRNQVRIAEMLYEILAVSKQDVIYSHAPDGHAYIDIEVKGYGDWRILLEDCNL